MSLSSSYLLAPKASGAPALRLLRQAALVVAAVALLTASAEFRIPMWPVPATLQTFAVLMIGAAYGPALAGVSVLGYLALGAAGAAVFTGGQGGLAYMVGPTGGYLLGFLVSAMAVGALARRGWDQTAARAAAALLVGNVVIYLFGLGWLAWLFAGHKGLGWVLQAGLFNFLPGDLVKLALAALLIPMLRRALRR